MRAKHHPRPYNHLSKSAFAQMERRTACHFTETNVQKRIKPKTSSSSLLSRALVRCCLPKKQIRLKGVDVPSCLCVILSRIIITICRRIKVTMFLSVPIHPPHLPHFPHFLSVSHFLSFSHFLSVSPCLHAAAQSPGPCLLAAPRRFWPEKREEG